MALAAYDELVRHLSDGSSRALVLTGVFASLAVLTRASIGLGPVVGLASGVGLRAVRAIWGKRRPEWRTLLGLAAASVLPVVLYAYVNHAKFGTFFSVPVSGRRRQLLRPPVPPDHSRPVPAARRRRAMLISAGPRCWVARGP